MRERVCLVVPCFNEAARLDFAAFGEALAGGHLWLVFVDDGSTDGTADVVRAHAGDHVWLERLPTNQGKAAAVRHGVLRARTLPFFESLDWIGFWDADLSTPLSELPRFFAYEALCGVRADAVFGARLLRLGSRIRRRAIRHVLGRAFVTVASNLLEIRAYDSQCGAKVFRPAVAVRAFADPFVSRWLFDVELILRLRDAVLIEYPLLEWADVSGSKLHILSNIWRTVIDLTRLRFRYGRRP